MDQRRIEELADRLREHERRVADVVWRGTAAIGRAGRAVARSRQAREHAASLFFRARWRRPIEVEAHQGERPRDPMSRPQAAALLIGDEPRRRTMEARCLRVRWKDASPRSPHEWAAMALYTKFGPLSGPLRSGAGYCAFGVFTDREARAPIGLAVAAEQDWHGLALWRLTIDTIDLPGLYVVIDREFRPVGWPARRGNCTARDRELGFPCCRTPRTGLVIAHFGLTRESRDRRPFAR
jgi:hypothetical protein